MDVVVPAFTGATTFDNPLPDSYFDPNTGHLIVSPTTLTGIFVLEYEICGNGYLQEYSDDPYCATSTITITLGDPNPIQANSDSGTFLLGSGGTINLLENDTFSGSQAHTGVVSVALTGTTSIPDISIDSSGFLIVPTYTLTGTYPLNYTICEILFPSNCSSAPITVIVTDGTNT